MATTTGIEVIAENAALVLGYGTENQAVVQGLNKLGLPVASRSEIKLSQFRRDFAVKALGEGEWSNITASGNLVKGDRKGQTALKKAMQNRTELKDDFRGYLNDTDFFTVDLANDANSALQVLKAGDSSATDKNAVFPFATEIIIRRGGIAYFFNHRVNVSVTFTAAAGEVNDIISDASLGFLTAGFAPGDTLIVEGSTQNDGQYLIANVTAGTLILSSRGAIVSSTTAAPVTLHAGTL